MPSLRRGGSRGRQEGCGTRERHQESLEAGLEVHMQAVGTHREMYDVPTSCRGAPLARQEHRRDRGRPGVPGETTTPQMKQRRTARAATTDVALAYRQWTEDMYTERPDTCVTREKENDIVCGGMDVFFLSCSCWLMLLLYSCSCSETVASRQNSTVS